MLSLGRCKKLLFLAFLFTIPLLHATTNFPYFQAITHFEQEQIDGHIINQFDRRFRYEFLDDIQRLSIFSLDAGYAYELESWVFTVEGRATTQLFDEDYTVPYYLSNFSNENINNVMLSVASVDYYHDNFAFSVGRNKIDFDYLYGSVDSIMTYYGDEYISATAFWFLNYYDFQYNYFTKYENINNDEGVYGLYLQSGEKLDNFIISIYNYGTRDGEYLTGFSAALEINDFVLNSSFTYANSFLDRAFLNQERYNRVWIDYYHDKSIFEIGVSKTGDSDLYLMLVFGSYPFSEFYLTNNINKKEARNIYAKYSYEDANFALNLVGGSTYFMAEQIIADKIFEVEANSYELDARIDYYFNKHWSVDVSFSYLKNSTNASLEFDQQLVSTNVVFQWL